MNENKNGESGPQKSLKSFFIKLISVSIAVIIIVSLLFNIFLAERLEKFDRIFSIGRSDIRHEVKEKIRNELSDSLNKENKSFNVFKHNKYHEFNYLDIDLIFKIGNLL